MKIMLLMLTATWFSLNITLAEAKCADDVVEAGGYCAMSFSETKMPESCNVVDGEWVRCTGEEQKAEDERINGPAREKRRAWERSLVPKIDAVAKRLQKDGQHP